MQSDCSGSSSLDRGLGGRSQPARTRTGSGSLKLPVAVVLLICLAPHDSSTRQPVSNLQNIDRALRNIVANGDAPRAVRVIVRTKPAARHSVRATVAKRGGRIEADHTSIGAFTATIDARDILKLATDPLIETVSLDALLTTDQAPIQVSTASALGSVALSRHHGTGAGIRIAVIDSGIEPTNDLDERRIIGFFDFTRDGISSLPFDDYGHGTHVAGLIAGNGTNSDGTFVGLAPDAEILALKVLGPTGSGYTSDVIQAIEFLVANQPRLRTDIINLSLGHPIFEPAATDPLVLAVEKAAEAGIVVVVAAGNFGRNVETGLVGYGGVLSPGNAPSAITVGALDTHQTIGLGDDTIPDYSSRGPTWYDAYAKPDVVAPGQWLVSIAALNSTLYAEYAELQILGRRGDIPRYMRLSGTSMATGVVSGSAALMLEAHARNGRTWSRDALRAILEWSAIPLPGYDTLTQGSGRVNIRGALALAGPLNARTGAPALNASPPRTTTIAGFAWPWAQTVVQRDMLLHLPDIESNILASGRTVVWGSGGKGDTVVWGSGGKGDTVVWGSSVVWDPTVPWSSNVVWGNGLLGAGKGDTVVWGSTQVTPATVVWGDLATVTGLSGRITFVAIADSQP